MFTAINEKVTLVVSFGPGQTGKTIGYTLLSGNGSTFQARTTTGVSEIATGSGIYQVELANTVFTAVFDGYVVWDVAGAAPYASEDITVTDRVDAAVSTRLATSGYTAPDNTDISAIKAKTDNLPSDPASQATTDSAISSAESTLAGLIGALPSASAVATAVWAAATRTLTSISAVAGAVWDVAISGHETAGSTGAALSAAGGAGDPWSTDLPGSYSGEQAGAILSAVQTKTAFLISGQPVTLSQPVSSGPGSGVQIVQGDDYKAVDGRALQWTSTSWPVITGATVVLELRATSSAVIAATYDATVLSASEAQIEITATETSALRTGTYTYALKATLSDGNVVTLVTGSLLVLEQP